MRSWIGKFDSGLVRRLLLVYPMAMLGLLSFFSDALRDFAAAIFVAAGFTVLEIFFPRTPVDGQSRVRGIIFSILQFWLAAAIVASSMEVSRRIGVHPLFGELLGWLRWVGPFAQIIGAAIYILVFEFFHYWFHRLLHGPLWRLHQVHHSIENMSAVSCYAHFGEDLVRFLVVVAPMAVLGFVGIQLPLIMVIWVTMQNSANHAATRLSYGPIGRWLVDNRFHRIHHSIEERHFHKNYGVLITVWDRVFGTAYFPAKDEWPETGLSEQSEPTTVRQFLLRPLNN